MIQYKDIKFETVDQLIDYQVRAEGLKLPNKTELPPLPETTLAEDIEQWLKKSPPPLTQPRPPFQPLTTFSIPCGLDASAPRVETNMHCRCIPKKEQSL